MEVSAPQKLTIAIIESLKSKGFSQSDIARQFGVTRQAVSWHKRHYGGRLSPKEMVLEHFPWSVPAPMQQASPFRRIRDHGEYIATGGVGMDEVKLSRLRTFYRNLRNENYVIEFDPEIPPAPGFAVTGGFAFRDRIASDADLLIRVNEHTFLTDKGRMIWRFRPIDP